MYRCDPATLVPIPVPVISSAVVWIKLCLPFRALGVLFRLFNDEHFNRHIGGNQFKAELVEQRLL